MIEITRASECDLPEILALQKLAFQSEAALTGDYSIPPLLQTLPELIAEAQTTVILKAVEDGRITGSVRACEKDGTCRIGRLIVHPECQNRGIGAKLLAEAEKCFGDMRCELFTARLSAKNIAFYQNRGYSPFKTETAGGDLKFLYLEKGGK